MSSDASILKPAYLSSRIAGMAAGSIITGLVACPTILLDWFHKLLGRCLTLEELPEDKSLSLCTYDLPHLLVHEEVKSFRIYQGGFFTSSKPVKIISELIGSLANALVAATTFVVVGLLEFALTIAATPFILVLGAAAIFAGGVYCMAQSYHKGLQAQCIDTINYLGEQFL